MSETKAIASEEQIREVLSNTDWGKLWPLLQAHGIHRLKYRYRIRKTKEELASFSRNLVQEVLDLVFLQQTRKWNMEAYPKLEDFLYGVMDSHLNNQLRTSAREIPSDEDQLVSQHESYNPGIQQGVIANELRDQIMKALQDLNADDNEILVFGCLFDGLNKPDDIRNELGISETEFHNIWRRVNRKREKLKLKLAQYGY